MFRQMIQSNHEKNHEEIKKLKTDAQADNIDAQKNFHCIIIIT